ncbi:MAG: hypothetical protein QOI80_496 [Solirubrobacteraceae bacterium]|jgi:hypothetical protein|nr:hypothetical protein [Solirubrobacteraceae bacterium]
MYEFIVSQHAVAPAPDRIARLLDVVRRDLEPDIGSAFGVWALRNLDGD